MPITNKREWLQGPYAKPIERAAERSKALNNRPSDEPFIPGAERIGTRIRTSAQGEYRSAPVSADDVPRPF